MMKLSLLTGTLLALTLASGCVTKQPLTPVPSGPPTYSSFDASSGTNAPVVAHSVRFKEADMRMILSFYQELSGRTLIFSPQVPLTAKITFENQTSLTRVEMLQALDNVLAMQGVTMVYSGSKFVKVVPASLAPTETGPVINRPVNQLPDSSSFLNYVVKLKVLKPEDAVAILAPYSKLPNSIIGVKGNNTLTLRDYSANVRRMLEVLEKLDRK